MRLYLIRHGRQCSQLCNVNVDLALEGFRQAELLGERLAGEKIEAVYSSHLLRAFQTAETANRFWNVEHIVKEELREIVDRMACGACWDVGHANFGKHPQYESMTLLGKRIRVLHLHDNYGTRDDHSMPYFGTIDWEEIMRALRDIGYEGTFNYEVAATHLPMALREDHARYLVDAAKMLLGR